MLLNRNLFKSPVKRILWLSAKISANVPVGEIGKDKSLARFNSLDGFKMHDIRNVISCLSVLKERC